jgi:hypothetical protein
MTSETLPTGPDPEAITAAIVARFPDAVVAQAMGATFFSLDESHWPNFATIVTTDEHDEGEPSRLSRPGDFRLNIGVGKATFERLVGDATDPDHSAFDTFVPHPVYGRQRWISILNPTDETFRSRVLPLLDEGHERLARSRARRGGAPHEGGSPD